MSFGNYQIEGSLGAGGMGAVFKARDGDSGEPVALKVLHAGGPTSLLNLKAEFRLARMLRHRNLARLYTLEADAPEPYFTMELIDGRDWIAATRDATPEQLARLFLQLMDGLDAIHRAGLLHRDIKPSNVMVTPTGRVVILDFGVSIPREARAGLAGTWTYMAPEAAMLRVEPASDRYSAGVMLYEVVAGAHPFPRGQRDQARKQYEGPEPLEGTLGQLATALLNPDPRLRPTRPEIYELLAALAPDAHGSFRQTVRFVGREAELARVHQVMAQPAGRLWIEGDPGCGKTALVNQALSSQDGLVLRARCHPDERVAFRALDGLVDDLARWLSRQKDRAALVPPDAGALLELFPVLTGPLGRLAPPVALDAQPVLRKARGIRGLAELVDRIARRQPVVVWIDDVQWADADSLEPLGLLLDTPIVVIFTGRPEAGPLADLDLPRMLLGPLDARDAYTLADQLGLEAARLKEAAGSPLHLHELASSSADGELSQLYAQKRRALTPEQDQALGLVLIGGPLEPWVLWTALPDASRLDTLDRLEASRLVRRTAQGRLDAWHDRVRESLAGDLDDAGLHRRLADALLDQPDRLDDGDARRVAQHLHGAQDPRAPEWWVRSARSAQARHAFDLAAEDLRHAVQTQPDPEWIAELAQCLDYAGRALAAAHHYTRAADQATGAQRDEWVLRAGTRLLISGELDRGRQQLVGLLQARGIAIPGNPLLAGVWRRLKLLLRGEKFQLRTDPPQAQRLRAEPFQHLNCATLKDELFEAEVFGTERGAYTGAVTRPGHVEQCAGGTLFLDEVGELGPTAQAKLLLLVDEGRYFRVGSSVERRADIRVLAATNADLEQRVDDGRFRRDLYYRLALFPIEVPGLNARRSDIPALVDAFVQRTAQRLDLPPPDIEPAAVEAAVHADWSQNNLRQLANAVERAVVFAASAKRSIQASDLVKPAESRPTTYREATRAFQKDFLLEALQAQSWNVTAAARQLGVAKSTLYALMSELGIERP